MATSSNIVHLCLFNGQLLTLQLDVICVFVQVYARTVGCEASHPSFGPVKQIAAQITHLLPDTVQLFGENMFGIHSIEYDRLEAYFYVFAALRGGSEWLSWDEVATLSKEMGLTTVPLVARGQVG